MYIARCHKIYAEGKLSEIYRIERFLFSLFDFTRSDRRAKMAKYNDDDVTKDTKGKHKRLARTAASRL